MLTFYVILLLTTDADGEPLEERLYAPFMEDVESLLIPRMNAGDTALVYQVDVAPPTTPEEAVAWVMGDARVNLQVLVAEVTRESEYEAPIITPTDMGSATGFMFSPTPEAQA